MHTDLIPGSISRQRITKETKITLTLQLVAKGENRINTGLGMLDHVIDLVFFWGDMTLHIACEGDTHIDGHHLIEDTGMMLGNALREALGNNPPIERTGWAKVPMDEALSEVCVDLSGRPWLEWHGGDILPPVIAHEEKDIWREFFKAFATGGRMNLHVNFLYGLNGHHLLESAAKGLGLALRQAIKKSTRQSVKSTKGGLD